MYPFSSEITGNEKRINRNAEKIETELKMETDQICEVETFSIKKTEENVPSPSSVRQTPMTGTVHSVVETNLVAVDREE